MYTCYVLYRFFGDYVVARLFSETEATWIRRRIENFLDVPVCPSDVYVVQRELEPLEDSKKLDRRIGFVFFDLRHRILGFFES